MFVLNSDITIGNFRFSGAKKVVISRSIHSIYEQATIVVPSVARIAKNGQDGAIEETTASLIADGDPVVIKLGYDGDLQEEFTGFVTQRDLNMPLEITCEGYSWLLSRNPVNISGKYMPIKELLQTAVAGISECPIKVVCDLDITLNNVQVNGTATDVIRYILRYTDGCVSCCFISPGTLWCGLVYTPIAKGIDLFNKGSVAYKLGYNVLKENRLQVRNVADNPVAVQYSKKLGGGLRFMVKSDVFAETGSVYNKILNQIGDTEPLRELADEKAYRLNYTGYEGSLHTFLQPYVRPGCLAYVADSRYPGGGTCLVESVSTAYGIRGARRIVELGPQIGFAKNK